MANFTAHAPPHPTVAKHTIAMWGTTVGALALHIVLSFPGVMTWDSRDQLQQAVTGSFNDWHPPIMAVLMRALMPLAVDGGPLLVLHLTTYWLALALIATTLAKVKAPFYGWIALLIGFLPPLWLLSVFVHKDVGMAVCFLAAFSFIFERRAKGLPLAWWTVTAFTILTSYAVLVRSNAVFALPPLLAYAVAPRWFAKPFACIALFAVTVPVSIVGSAFVNHHVIGADRHGSTRSLFVFDVTGIGYFSQDVSVFPDERKPRIDLVNKCYSPKMWDVLGSGECAIGLHTTGTEQKFRYTSVIRAILQHPLAYASHRLVHMNHELYGFVPFSSYHWEESPLFPHMPKSSNEGLEKDLTDYVANFPLFSPLVWLAFSFTLLCFLLYHSHNLKSSPLGLASGYLCFSVCAYTLAFAVVGVADLYRYQQYLISGSAISTLLFFAARTQLENWATNALRWAGATGGLTLLGVSVARMSL